MAQINFDELKALVSITDVAQWLGIKVKQTGDTYRGDCVLCGAERSFTLTPKKGLGSPPNDVAFRLADDPQHLTL